MKYPIGIQSFDQIIEDGYVYVDKTALVYRLVTEGKIYFLSRPRRFGKSLLLSTLKNYFLGRKELFKGLAIDALEKDWLTYPVFHIDFNGRDFKREGELEFALEYYISSWEREWKVEKSMSPRIGDRFIRLLEWVHRQTGRGAVVLIDEYDKPMLDVLDTGVVVMEGENSYGASFSQPGTGGSSAQGSSCGSASSSQLPAGALSCQPEGKCSPFPSSGGADASC